MRKLVITKKKKITAFNKPDNKNGKWVKAAALFMAFGMATGSGMQVYAVENTEEEQSISYIYHQHIGNSEAEGGCYKQPVYHEHAGDELVGGDCYETPVYHSHTGDEVTGGDCYATMVYHAHEGDGSAAEGCYQAVYHRHSGDCYKKVSSSEYGCYTEKVVDTSDGDYEGHDYKYYYMSCGSTIHGTNSSHTHSVLNCNRGSEVTGYELGCGKTEESLEGYVLSCTKTDEIIDAYSLSCLKTAEVIEGYARDCGKEEDIPYGKILITKQPAEDSKTVSIKVEFEDLTGGELQLAETPYIWYDGQGNELGTGDSMTVSENGIYGVLVGVTNEDIKEESLHAEVSVDSIKKPVAENNGHADEDKDADSDGEEESVEEIPETTPIALPTITPSPTVAPTVAPSLPIVSAGEKETLQTDSEKITVPKRKDTEEKGPSATPASDIKSETETVLLEERQSESEQQIEVQEVENETGLFSSPIVKMITLTAGTLALLAGIVILCYLFRWSVKIYNDDGQGKMIYLGRCMVRNEEDGYLIEITERMTERAVTNRYCIKPGLFRVGRGKEEELLVERQKKRISVPLEKEMTVVI